MLKYIRQASIDLQMFFTQQIPLDLDFVEFVTVFGRELIIFRHFYSKLLFFKYSVQGAAATALLMVPWVLLVSYVFSEEVILYILKDYDIFSKISCIVLNL